MQHKSSPMQWTQCYIQILYPRPMQGKKKTFQKLVKLQLGPTVPCISAGGFVKFNNQCDYSLKV